MVSPTASTCEHYTAGCTKKQTEILQPQNSEKERNAPGLGRKGENGCVLGAGEGCSRYGRVGKPEIRTKMHQIAMQHMKKGNRRKPCVFAGFLAGAEGLEPSARGFGVDVGERSRERRRARCHPVPAASPRKAGAGLVLRAIFGEGLCIDYHFFLRKKSTSARRMAKLTRITAG